MNPIAFACKHCPFASRKRAAMLMHERMRHRGNAGAEERVKERGPRKRPDIIEYGDPSAKYVAGANNECSLCPSDTRITANLSVHLKKHKEKDCPKARNDACKIMRAFHGDQPHFYCKDCSYVSYWWQKLSMHRKNCKNMHPTARKKDNVLNQKTRGRGLVGRGQLHGNNNENNIEIITLHDFTCKYCELSFSKRERRTMHQRIDHPIAQVQRHLINLKDGGSRIKPKTVRYGASVARSGICFGSKAGCRFETTSKLRLREHLHKCNAARKSRAYKTERAFHDNGNRYDYYCNLCNFKTYWRQKLASHKRSCENTKEFKCNLCNKSFFGKDKLLMHRRLDHPTTHKTFECPTNSKDREHCKRPKLINCGNALDGFGCEVGCGFETTSKVKLVI